MFEFMFEDVLVDVQTEYEWRGCFEALQEAKNSFLSVVGVSPLQTVFGHNPEVPGDLLSDSPDAIAHRSILHDRGAGQSARVRPIARTRLLHADTMNARRALDTRPGVVPSFLPGDMKAVWRTIYSAMIADVTWCRLFFEVSNFIIFLSVFTYSFFFIN